jgi:hypothetical protein
VSGTGGAIEKPMSVEFCPDDEPKQQAAAELKKLFDRYGSDKATFHDYHLLYGSILVERETVTTMLEIGIGTHYPDVVSTMGAPGKPGASLRAFRDFLPNATIYGADVDKRILFAEDRIRTFFVDQTDRCSFEQLTANFDGAEFDLIIDDGLHSPDANIETLLFGLGRLKVGGSFVVEDIAPSAEPIWQVVGALLPEKYEHHVISAKNGMLFWIRRAAR